MKKYFVLIILIVILLAACSDTKPLLNDCLSREMLKNSGGTYWGDGIIHCDTEWACLHETAEMLRDKYGDPCLSEEWRTTIDAWVTTDFPGVQENPMANAPWGEWGGYCELYPELYAMWRMNFIELPPEIYVFYQSNWKELTQ